MPPACPSALLVLKVDLIGLSCVTLKGLKGRIKPISSKAPRQRRPASRPARRFHPHRNCRAKKNWTNPRSPGSQKGFAASRTGD